MTTKRECGRCHACCYTAGVEALKKAPFSACQHILPIVDEGDPGCCGCYENRPEECRAFSCVWLEDDFGQRLSDQHRPDRCGMLFEIGWIGGTPDDPTTADLIIYTATPTVRGAFRTKEHEAIAEKLLCERSVILWSFWADTEAGEATFGYTSEAAHRKAVEFFEGCAARGWVEFNSEAEGRRRIDANTKFAWEGESDGT